MITREALISRIVSHTPKLLAETAKESAVLLLILQDGEDFKLVITKRSGNVAYPGDYCFPGGTRDLLERDFNLTAMRELKEELNIAEECYQMMGQLNDFHDRNGNLVRPFVAIMSQAEFEKNVQIAPDEIESVYFFPFHELTNIAESPELEKLTKRHPAYLYIHDDIRIWGLTASIMVHFANLVYKLDKSVAYEIKK